MGVISFISVRKELNVYDLLQKLEQKGWHLAHLSNPAALHLAITSFNIGQVNDFIASIKWGVSEVSYFNCSKIEYYIDSEEPS